MVKPVLLSLATGVAGLLIGLSVTGVAAQEAPKTQRVNDFPNLPQGLMDTPGCLGVTTMSQKGQFVIFAWFENKAAVNAWYHSKMHTDVMKKFFPAFQPKKEALPGFKDSKAPVLMIASVTPSDKAAVAGSSLAVSQIAIEAYTPVPGGLAYGKTFAPDKLKVPGLVKIPLQN